jgi:hypothetical protein
MVQRKLHASSTQGYDAVITDLKNQEILSKLANNTNVLEFLLKLRPDELESFLVLIRWSPSLLMRFKDQPEHMRVLLRIWSLVPDRDSFMKTYFEIYYNENSNESSILDAFSQGQIDSKVWLINTLVKLDQDLGRIWILCGWIGSLAYLMFRKKEYMNFTSIRSFDIDPVCADLADMLNRQEVKNGWMFKASTADVVDLKYDDHLWLTKKYDGSMERDFGSADTVINTSCEHLEDFDTWFGNIPKGKLVVLQCNNSPDLIGHVNSMSTMYELNARATCSRVYFKGTLDCGSYERYMLIGKK